jgi:hypothetical protein
MAERRTTSPPPKKRTTKKTTPAAPAKPRTRGPGKPRFEPASPEDFALVLEKANETAARAKGRTKADRALARVERDTAIIAKWALGIRTITIAAQQKMDPEHVN